MLTTLPRGGVVRRRSTASIPIALGLTTGVLVTLLVAPAVARAHAELDTVSPADKSTVVGSPSEIVMTFVQNLDPTKSSIKIVDASSKVVVQGGTFPAGKPREMDLAIATPLAPATYSIRWTTVSTEDGETAHGTTTFTVQAAPSPTPSPSTAPSVAPSEAASAPASASPAPSAAAPSAAPSSPPTAPAPSTSDAVIPVVIAVIVLAGLGVWLLRGRARSGR